MVGVGPGDPSLLTLAAVEAIRRSNVVAYPIGRPAAESMAARIASAWIRSDHERLPLLFPMVEAAEPRRTAWAAAATHLQNAVRSGQQVALLCEGDASLFASCSYVLLAIRQEWPDCPVTVIPGVTSCSAAAAAANLARSRDPKRLLVRTHRCDLALAKERIATTAATPQCTPSTSAASAPSRQPPQSNIPTMSCRPRWAARAPCATAPARR